MAADKNSTYMRIVRHQRVRRKVQGTAEKPRLSVFRSLNHIYSQVIDDSHGHTLAAASTLDTEVRGQKDGMSKTHISGLVGSLVAQRAKKLGISQVVFDRGGHKYLGRVKALAESAREGGLVF